MKLRPVLLLTEAIGPVPEVLVAYISSVVPSVLLPSDVLIDPALPQFQTTHLKVISVLRLHKLATIHMRTIARGLGSLRVSERATVAAKLRRFLDLEKY
jgi:mRNA interferase MazF